MPTGPFMTFRHGRIDPCVDPFDASEMAVNLKPSTVYPAGTILGEMIGTDEIQTITIDAAGGTWLWNWNSGISTPIAWDATAAEAQAIMEAVAQVGPGNIQVSKPSALVFQTTFRGALGSQNVAAATTTATALTGGANTAVVATATAGVAGTQGQFAAYAAGNTDGSQFPKGVLRYACVTDAAGVITLGDGPAGTSEWGQTTRSVDMFYKGVFRCEDLVGLTAAAIPLLGGKLLNGTVAHGRLSIFGS